MKICESSPEKTIFSAIKKYNDFVSPTYGPAGKKTLIVQNEFNVEAVDDGKRTIQAFEIEDELENAVIQFVKETTEKGKDGTTTAGIIMSSIVLEALKNVDDPLNSNDRHALVLGLRKGLNEAVKAIKSSSKKIKTQAELYDIAYNSYNNDKIAKLVSETIFKIGKDGVLSIEDSKGIETTVDIVNGLEIPKGYASPYFITQEDKVILENPKILLVSKKINLFSELIPAITKVSTQRPGARDFVHPDIVIMAEGFGDDVINKCIAYKMMGQFRPLLIETPGFGDKVENLADLAIILGAKIVDDKAVKLSEFKEEYLGLCDSVKSTRDKTVFLGGKGKTTEYVSNLKLQLQNAQSNFDKDRLTKRIAAISGGVAVIKIGAYTEKEQKAMKTKVENAINSAQIAFKGGVVAGAGKALEIKTSSDLLNIGLEAPRAQLERNGIMYLDDKAVDPTDVVITALETAVSIASELLECGGISAIKREKKEDIKF